MFTGSGIQQIIHNLRKIISIECGRSMEVEEWMGASTSHTSWAEQQNVAQELGEGLKTVTE